MTEELLDQGNKGWQWKCKRDGHRWFLGVGNIGGPRWVMECRVCGATRRMTPDERDVVPSKYKTGDGGTVMGNKWLLSREQRGEVYNSLADEATENEARVALCKAQGAKTMKKMVEWLEKKLAPISNDHGNVEFEILGILQEDWQALKKEVLEQER